MKFLIDVGMLHKESRSGKPPKVKWSVTVMTPEGDFISQKDSKRLGKAAERALGFAILDYAEELEEFLEEDEE